MTDTRRTALNLLNRFEADSRYLSLSIPNEIKDKAFLTALIYTTVEHKITLDYYIGKLTAGKMLGMTTRNILRLGLCQLLYLTVVPSYASVNATVALASKKSEAGLVNAVLRTALREPGNLTLPPREKNEPRYLSIAYSVPLPTVRALIAAFGTIRETEDFLKTVSHPAPTSLTVNTRLISRKDFLTQLQKNGIKSMPSPYTANGVTLCTNAPIPSLYGFDDGFFFVQDEAALLSVEALAPLQDELVLDVCAAPGGKSFAAAVITDDKAIIKAYDLHENKLSLIESGKRRLGLSSLSCGVRDATKPDKALLGKADAVICDVPCSGLGVMAKKPDIRYKSESTFTQLPALQLSILEASFAALKENGRLVYSTCTVLPSENREVISAFLGKHPEAEMLDFTVGSLSSKDGMLTLLPHIHHTDGFFVAKLRRKR